MGKEKQQRKKAAEEAKAKEEEEAERARLKVLRERAVKPFNMFARQPTQRDLLARAAEARIRNMAKARKCFKCVKNWAARVSRRLVAASPLHLSWEILIS